MLNQEGYGKDRRIELRYGRRLSIGVFNIMDELGQGIVWS